MLIDSLQLNFGKVLQRLNPYILSQKNAKKTATKKKRKINKTSNKKRKRMAKYSFEFIILW